MNEQRVERLRFASELNGRVSLASALRCPSDDPIDLQWLESAFGRGDDWEKRRALYYAVCEVCNQNGPKAADLIRKLVRKSRRKNSPDRWFCCVVMSRLREEGFQM